MTRTKSTYLALLAVLLSPLAANADPITYVYDGGLFTSVGPGVPAGVTRITGTFTVDLPASASNPGINYSILDFLFSDGLSVIGPTTHNVVHSRFATDAAGFITDFALGVLNSSVGVGENRFIDIRWDPAGPPSFFGTSSHSQYCSGLNQQGRCIRTSSAFNRSTPTLSTQVPEPGTLALLGIGLFGMGLARRRRKV